MYMLNKIIDELKITPETRLGDLSPRAQRIITHYEHECVTGRMDVISALDRCLGDLAGRNYHLTRDQRTKITL